MAKKSGKATAYDSDQAADEKRYLKELENLYKEVGAQGVDHKIRALSSRLGLVGGIARAAIPTDTPEVRQAKDLSALTEVYVAKRTAVERRQSMIDRLAKQSTPYAPPQSTALMQHINAVKKARG